MNLVFSVNQSYLCLNKENTSELIQRIHHVPSSCVLVVKYNILYSRKIKSKLLETILFSIQISWDTSTRLFSIIFHRFLNMQNVIKYRFDSSYHKSFSCTGAIYRTIEKTTEKPKFLTIQNLFCYPAKTLQNPTCRYSKNTKKSTFGFIFRLLYCCWKGMCSSNSRTEHIFGEFSTEAPGSCAPYCAFHIWCQAL